mgnify:CR=1 FL=1
MFVKSRKFFQNIELIPTDDFNPWLTRLRHIWSEMDYYNYFYSRDFVRSNIPVIRCHKGFQDWFRFVEGSLYRWKFSCRRHLAYVSHYPKNQFYFQLWYQPSAFGSESNIKSWLLLLNSYGEKLPIDDFTSVDSVIRILATCWYTYN